MPVSRRFQPIVFAGLIAGLLLSAGCGPQATLAPTLAPTAAALTPAPATAAPTALPPTAAPQPADVSGQWLGAETFPTDPAKPGYLLVTFSTAGDALSGDYALPMINHTGALDAPALNGSHLTWAIADRGRALTFEGDVAGDTFTGNATLSGEAVPLTFTRLADGIDSSAVLGWYAVDNEHLIAIFRDGDQVLYRDWLTGRMGVLLPVSADTYVGGPAWQVPAPVETHVTFTRTAAGVTGLLFEQTGQPPFSATRAPSFYKTTEGRFSNGDVTLAGTLVTPDLPGAPPDALYPAIVSLHGSEPGRRRDTFRWLAAEWLAYYGIATLVYDKRGVGDSTGKYLETPTDSNIENLAHDALAGLAWLKTQPNIDPAQIGALGASQAGWVGPRMAAASPEVAFLVMVVGPSVSPSQNGFFVSQVTARPHDGTAQLDDALTTQVLNSSQSPFDQLAYLQATTVPALWIYGGLDTHIPGYASAEIIDRLRQAGQTNLDMMFYPEGNHSMFGSRTGFDDESPYLPGFIPGWNAAELHWILDHVRLPGVTSAAAQPVSFATDDGTLLTGTQYGAGRTAVIFATTSDAHQATWAGVAQAAAEAGYLALTFDFSFWQPDGQRDFNRMNAADADLLAAVAYVRSQGAERVVVIGASLGGLAAAKIAAQAELAGLVVLGAPMGDPALTIAVTPEELAAATMPKLFIVSANDTTVPAAKTQAMYAAAAEPKDIVSYPSALHATDLFTGPLAADLQAALLDFLQANTPPE